VENLVISSMKLSNTYIFIIGITITCIIIFTSCREYFQSDPLAGIMPRDPTCPRGQMSKKTGFPCSGPALPGGDDVKYSESLYQTATGLSSAGNYDRNPNDESDEVDYTKTDVLSRSAMPNYANWLPNTNSLGHYTGENNIILPQSVHTLGNTSNNWGGGRDQRIINLLTNALANQRGATGKTGATGCTGGTGGCKSSIPNWWTYGWDSINHRCTDEIFYRGPDGKIHSYCGDNDKNAANTIRDILKSENDRNRLNRNQRTHNYTFDTPTTNTYTDNNELPHDYNRQNTGSCDDDDEECDDC
jgi:hypothetical protein